VDKSQFVNVLHHFSNSSVDEAQEILSLKADFPYSQMLHALAARVSKDHGFANQQQELQLAAVYASDRTVLKDIMTKTFTENVDRPLVKSTTAVAAMTAEIIPETHGDLADEVIHDLDRLHQLKHNFEMMFIDIDPVELKNPAAEKLKASSLRAVTEAIEKPKESSKSRKERIVELARALAAENPPVEPVTKDSKPHGKKKDHPGDTLIEEIKSTKQELEPSDEKLKEQIEIIDHFIKTQPSIVNTKEKQAATPAGDLSSIKSGEFSDHVVSETLVEILVQQGKKDKAIEVLKKLIWKFPQKKTYFAAQIEELKK
jgi:hypothetical protein